MESGGKAVTKRYRKKITVVLSLVLPVILLFAILNCFTTYVFYEDYKYKMNLMTEIAAKEEFSGLDAVSELLKDKDIETNEQGRRLLEQYGYWGNKGNAFYMQFRHQVMVTGAVSTVICVLLLTFLLYWKKKEDACHQKILDQLEEILIRFRENKFDATKYKNDFQKEKYDRIIVNVPKGQKAVIDAEAKKQGYKSLNAFVVEAINEKMK
jgi:two-component system sensor histidine kinase VicK